VDYKAIYERLIRRARHNYPFGLTERHHILPRSMGGTDDWDNLVRLTPREHYLAHLLLYRMGNHNQIFGAMLICERHRLPRKRWLRKWHAWGQARALREANRRRIWGE
jgi:hypothetical protein